VAHLRVGRSLVRSPQRRQTGWGVGPKSGVGGNVGSTLSTTSSALGGIVAVPGQDGLTMVRLRGEFMARLLSATAAGDGFFGAVGVALFNDTAISIGITALNTPITDEGWDGWLWHRYFAIMAVGPISGAAAERLGQVHNVTAAVRHEVDSKAMRKVPVGMSIAVVIQVTVDTTATMQWQFNSRTLSKLP